MLGNHRVQGKGGPPPAGDALMRASLDLRRASNDANGKANEARGPAGAEVRRQVATAELGDEPAQKFASLKAYFGYLLLDCGSRGTLGSEGRRQRTGPRTFQGGREE